MKRLLIDLPEDVLKKIEKQAAKENRTRKKHIEYVLIKQSKAK